MTEEKAKPLIVAVSGGIDSVALLHLLKSQNLPLVVAHANHGIRADSNEDEVFVGQLAAEYGLPFESARLNLGSDASEEQARTARYKWLEMVRRKHEAGRIATAHHEDDVFETIFINLMRGTGWRGLCSLRDTPDRYRPLLGWSKVEVAAYAIDHELEWREDSTNESLRYLRNRIRHVIPRMDPEQRQMLRQLYDSQVSLRHNLDTECRRLLTIYCEDGRLQRYPLIMSPDSVSIELLRMWLDEPLEQARLRGLLLFSKTARDGAKWSLDKRRFVVASKRRLIVLAPRD